MMVTFSICEGNPGALTFLMQAYDLDLFGAEYAFGRMNHFGIRGARLYMLWNDCCRRDTKLALTVMKKWPLEVLQERINYGKGRGLAILPEEADKYETPPDPGPYVRRFDF